MPEGQKGCWKREEEQLTHERKGWFPKSEGPPLELKNKKRNGPLGSTGVHLSRLGWVQIEVQIEVQTVPDIRGLSRQAFVWTVSDGIKSRYKSWYKPSLTLGA